MQSNVKPSPAGGDKRFSFLDVTSLWQDPVDTTKKLMTIRKLEYQEKKSKAAKVAIMKKMALNNSIDSSFISEDDYKDSELD